MYLWVSRSHAPRGSMPHQSESHAGSNGYPAYVERPHQHSRKLPWQPSGPSIACLIAVGLAAFAGSARADLWGYLDEQGGAHFATQKIDERYQLFFKGDTNLDVAARAKAAAPSASEDFSHSRMYQYVAKHPNVAKFAPRSEEHTSAL